MRPNNRTALVFLLAFASVLLLSSCAAPLINTEALKASAFPMIARHDAYVQEDATVSPEEVMSFIAESSFVHTLIDQNEKVSRETFGKYGWAVTLRHDEYVEVDGELSAFERAAYLRTTKILRQIMDG
jgi:hypothetical protein